MAKKTIQQKKLDPEALSNEYTDLMNKIDEFTKRKEEVRKEILNLHEEGVDFNQFHISVIPSFHYDFEKCMEVYKQKTGKDPPMQHFPEQVTVIPAHDELDREMFNLILDREAIKEGTTSYTVKRGKK